MMLPMHTTADYAGGGRATATVVNAATDNAATDATDAANHLHNNWVVLIYKDY